MDEPTSSVDLTTEKQILGGVIDAFPKASLLISLHRLHLLPHFDCVMMIENGKVVASGTIPELLNTTGPVRNLWQSYIHDDKKMK